MTSHTCQSSQILLLPSPSSLDSAQFLRKLGLPLTVDFYDVYGFDDELLAMVPPNVLSVLFLFPADDKVRIPMRYGYGYGYIAGYGSLSSARFPYPWILGEWRAKIGCKT